MASVDLREVATRLAARVPSRTEADLQSDVRLLLLFGDLNLGDDDLHVALEAQVGEQKRIDVEIGFTVIECKKDLRSEKVRARAVEQLADYLRLRTSQTEQRYVGVLTDGADWLVYILDGQGLPHEVSRYRISPAEPDIDGLKVWLEGVLATRQNIIPNPNEIRQRLGAGTSSFAIDRTSLETLYLSCKSNPEVAVKRMLWARLLTTAFGSNFQDEDHLFLEHTYLVVVAELIAHVVIGLNIRDKTATELLSGEHFTKVGIAGVVEADFFDWVAQADGGEQFIRDLARRISRFEWTGVKHDVLKILYESIIGAGQRKSLGEYYTPDWLAERIVTETVTEPLTQRVLDPACGSGTFLFYAIRHYLAAADRAGVENAEAVAGAIDKIYGVDLHPVAVALARVTYLLAIGLDRLQDRGPIRVPVNIGDSLQWGQDKNLYTDGGLVVYTADGTELFASELRWPASVATDAGRFDKLVSDLSARAVDRPRGARPLKPIAGILKNHKIVNASDKATIEATYRILCALHDEGRNHIWGYYVRNLARPYWLSQTANRPSVLVGNPPWLSYRFMTEQMKDRFRRESEARGIWAGSEVSTSQDLSGYFVARCAQLYLNKRGAFGFVMPLAAISRPHFEGFRRGSFPSADESTSVSFDVPWDIGDVRPLVFPMPASVVFGTRTDGPKSLGDHSLRWSGHIPLAGTADWSEAQESLQAEVSEIARPTGLSTSPYGPHFRQGASMVPRSLITVEKLPPGPLGVPKGQVRVRSLKSSQDKKPWKEIPSREGLIEEQFLFQIHLGTTLLPFRLLDPLDAVAPVLEGKVLESTSQELEDFPAMAQWWEESSKLWRKYSRDPSLTLSGRLDYHGLLRGQFPLAEHRVVYNRSGTRLTAAYVSDTYAIIDTKLYWASVRSTSEADYLCAIFNSTTMTELVNPKQSRGHFGPRDFYSLPFEFPIPLFDPSIPLHADLARLGGRSRALALAVNLAEVASFQRGRKVIADLLQDRGMQDAANQLTASLLELA